MRKPAFPLFMKLALIGIFLAPSIAHAALFSATWVAGSAGGSLATGTMGTVNLNLATVGVGNSTQIFPGTWQQILPPSLGTLYPDAAISIGYNCNGSAQNQSVTFSTPVTDPYLLFNYVDLGSVYNFSGVAGNVALVGNTVNAALSNKVITLATPGSYNQSSSGFAIQLTGTYSSINYTITNSSCNSGHDSAGFDVAETGFSITPTVGPNGTVSPNQVITVLPNTKASFSVTPNNGYVANMGGTCGGTFSGKTYTTSTVTQDCTVTADFVTNPQAQLNLSASPTGINVSATSTLTPFGGSGTGAVSYTVSGPCTISGNTLTGTAAGSCVVTATKAGDVTFAPVTSNAVTVLVSLAPQSGLLLTASNTGIIVGATSTLSTTGGSGSGLVSYSLISGPCTLNGAIVTGTGAGECKLGATKAADSTYALIASNEVTIHVDRDPQAKLQLHADKTGIVIGQTSLLSTDGGSGTGSVSYSVIKGPCTTSANALYGSAQGTCEVQATKAADSTYNQTTSNVVNVFVDLDPQQTLYLYPNPSGIVVGGISGLATSGGSGSGIVTYTVISGPCTLSGNQLIGKAAGLCQVSATKQADNTYAATTSNIESVYVVLAPQAALNLTASNTGITVGSTSTLSTSGGSGTGTVAYQVLSGPCTLNGALLTGRGIGTCLLLATKAADGTYAETSSNVASVYVVLAPQPILTLIANPSSLNVGGTSSLSTLGGAGSGNVTYLVLNGPCTLNNAQLIGKAAGTCQVQATKAADGTYAALSSNLVSVLVNLAPQAPLNLTASNTSISVGSTSTLSASGGSGNGTVTYRVLSGPCLLNGAVLTGSGAGTCLMTASRAADSSYGETTSNTVSVLVNLIPQSGLNLTISTPSLTQGGTATLTATGGSGSGTVFYEVLSGPCTLNGNSLIGRGPGSCVVRATKAQSNGYAETTSNSVVESVTAPTPTPAPIPTLPEWAKITMMFLMFLTVGWYGWRLKR